MVSTTATIGPVVDTHAAAVLWLCAAGEPDRSFIDTFGRLFGRLSAALRVLRRELLSGCLRAAEASVTLSVGMASIGCATAGMTPLAPRLLEVAGGLFRKCCAVAGLTPLAAGTLAVAVGLPSVC